MRVHLDVDTGLHESRRCRTSPVAGLALGRAQSGMAIGPARSRLGGGVVASRLRWNIKDLLIRGRHYDRIAPDLTRSIAGHNSLHGECIAGFHGIEFPAGLLK